MSQATDKPTLLVPAAVPSTTASHPPEDVTTPWTAVSDAAKKSPAARARLQSCRLLTYPARRCPRATIITACRALRKQHIGRRLTGWPGRGAGVGACQGPEHVQRGQSHFRCAKIGTSPRYSLAGPNQGNENSRAVDSSLPAADPPSSRYGYTTAPPSTFAAMPGPASGSTRGSDTSGFNRSNRNQPLQSTASDLMPPGNVTPYNSNSSYPTYLEPSDSSMSRATENYNSAGGTYKVQPNNNYWVISEKVYGSGAYFNALAEVNRSKVAKRDKLRVGDMISTPTIAQLEQSYPQLCPKPSHRDTVRSRSSLVSTHSPYTGGRTYEVQEGDRCSTSPGMNWARPLAGRKSTISTATRWARISTTSRRACS